MERRNYKSEIYAELWEQSTINQLKTTKYPFIIISRKNSHDQIQFYKSGHIP